MSVRESAFYYIFAMLIAASGQAFLGTDGTFTIAGIALWVALRRDRFGVWSA